MKNLTFFIVYSIISSSCIFAMDTPYSNAEKSILVTKQDSMEIAFHKLINNNGLLLKNRLEREKRGEFCKDLADAEETIRNAFVLKNNTLIPVLKKKFQQSKNISEPPRMDFLFYVAQKKEKTAECIEAINQHNLETCKTIINHNPYVINSFHELTSINGTPGYTTLLNYVLIKIKHTSSEQEDMPIVAFLLGKGANPNTIDSNAFTSLFYASTPELIQLLISHGAKTQKTPAKTTPLIWHIKQHSHRKLKTSYWMIKNLLCDETAINKRDENGNTALHVASSKNHPLMVKVLLENGADCSIRNRKKLTACHVARRESLTLLRKHIHSLICSDLHTNRICKINRYKPIQQTLALTYMIDNTPIIEWATKMCVRNQKLNYSVLYFNQDVSTQWLYSNKFVAEGLLEAFSISMVNPYGDNIFYPLLKAIEQNKFSKIKILLEKGVTISKFLLKKIKSLKKSSLYIVAKKQYNTQACFKCNTLMNKNMFPVYLLINYEAFITCPICKPQGAIACLEKDDNIEQMYVKKDINGILSVYI